MVHSVWGLFLGLLRGWCQNCMILMAFQVWFCRFLHESVLKSYPDVVCHWVSLGKNAVKSSASCWSDVDSGSGLCLFWPVISMTNLYSFILSVFFVLTRLCIRSTFFYLSICEIHFIPFRILPVLILPVLDPFPFSILQYLSLVFRSLSYRGFCVYWLLFLLWLEKLSQWFEHFIVKLVGCLIDSCVFQNGYVVDFTFEFCNCIITESLQGSLF